MITDEMVEMAIAAGTPEVSPTRDYLYDYLYEQLRAALAAVLPLIRNAALEEAAGAAREIAGDLSPNGRTFANGYANGALDAERAIRAMKETPNE